MRKSLNEILDSAKVLFEGNFSDEVLNFLEDLQDSYTEQDITSYETKISELEKKVSDTESEWREKYKNRFFSQEDDQISVVDDTSSQEPEEDEAEVPSVEEIAKSFK